MNRWQRQKPGEVVVTIKGTRLVLSADEARRLRDELNARPTAGARSFLRRLSLRTAPLGATVQAIRESILAELQQQR